MCYVPLGEVNMIIGISLLYWFSATTSYFAAIFGVIFRLSICDHISLVMFAQTTENGSSRMYPAEKELWGNLEIGEQKDMHDLLCDLKNHLSAFRQCLEDQDGHPSLGPLISRVGGNCHYDSYSTIISVAGLETCLLALRTSYETFKANSEFGDPVGPADVRNAVLEEMARMHVDQQSLKAKKGSKTKGTDSEDILPAANCTNDHLVLIFQADGEDSASSKSGGRDSRGSASATGRGGNRDQCGRSGGQRSNNADGAAANHSRAAHRISFDDHESVEQDDCDKNFSAGSDADHINSTSWINAVRKNSARVTGGNEALVASAPAPPVVKQDE